MQVKANWQVFPLFQSTLPRGERPEICTQLSNTRNFNPRSREGSDRGWVLLHNPQQDFNPRSREGSDLCLIDSGYDSDDFNPRSREGSDGDTTQHYISRQDFNPRSREGSDNAVCKAAFNFSISIHAPARGATTTQQGN